MVDQAGQDPVEVEPAADVAGDPAQRLGAMEQVGDLVGALGDADDGPDRVGRDARRARGRGSETSRRPRRRRAGRPTARAGRGSPRRARDGRRAGRLGPRRAGGLAERARRAAVPRPDAPVARRRASSARPRMPNARGRSSRRADRGPAPRPRRHAASAGRRELPDRHEVMPVRIADAPRATASRTSSGSSPALTRRVSVDATCRSRWWRSTSSGSATGDVASSRPARRREAGDGRRVDRAPAAPRARSAPSARRRPAPVSAAARNRCRSPSR